MPRLYLLLLAAILGGCIFISDEPPVTPTPTPTPVPALRVLEATYGTNFSANGRPAICDNRPTTITYRFRYEGTLESWTSYLQGTTLNEIKGQRTFDPASQGVNPTDSGFEVSYVLGENAAPYSNEPDSNETDSTKTDRENVSPQAIVVVPVPQPTPIGSSKLHLILEGAGGDSRPYVSPEIPVIINCPTS